MTNTASTPAAVRRSPGRAASDWIGRVQAALSDYAFADGDRFARYVGWEITKGTGLYGFGNRAYRDRRFATRRAAVPSLTQAQICGPRA